MLVRASRGVSRGEEVTLRYVAMAAPREERRMRLLRGFGFACRCAMCADDWDAERRDGGQRALLRLVRSRARGDAVGAERHLREALELELRWAWYEYFAWQCIGRVSGGEERREAEARAGVIRRGDLYGGCGEGRRRCGA
jgi:hypothetical protein